jgi:hypothetical protein
MISMNFNDVIDYLKEKKYVIYTKPYQLNIVGVRNRESIPNAFDDKMFVFWKDDKNKWQVREYPITTDLGTYYLLHPLNKEYGSALLKSGQYIDSYRRDYHRGKYMALVQSKPVSVYRDYNRNGVFDVFTKITTGDFGINIHKAGEDSIKVDKNSAGCQVFKRRADFDDFMRLTELHQSKYGNRFTYTLLDERAEKRKAYRYGLYGTLFIATASLGATLYMINRKTWNQ